MSSPVNPSSPRQVLLGLFILSQLAFLISSNMLGLIQSAPTDVKEERRVLMNRVLPRFADEQGHGWAWAEQVETNARRWAQLTGHDQNWALFTNLAKATGFPGVILVWDDPSETDASTQKCELSFHEKNGFDLGDGKNFGPWNAELFLSENEPPDINHFIRFGLARDRRYEGQLYLNPQPDDENHENRVDLAERLTRRTRRLVTDYGDLGHAYLRQRLKTWQKDNPDRPAPKQVILVHRLYRIKGPEEPIGWEGPYMIPLARWQPNLRRPHHHVLEPFDFTDLAFYPLGR